MKIEIDKINSIRPGYKLSHDLSLQMDINMSHRQQEDTVYRIWENLGDNIFLGLITSEGYTVDEIKDKTDLMGLQKTNQISSSFPKCKCGELKKISAGADIEYVKDRKRYRKIGRDKFIKPGAMHSWCGGELMPIAGFSGETVGDTPSNFSAERDFYNPII